MTEDERARVLKQNVTPPLYYRLDDYRYDIEPKTRVLSGIRTLDFNLKGFEMGAVTIWTGFTNAGKTTVMTMLISQTIRQGERVFFFNGEQTKEDFKNNLYIQASTNQQLVKKQYKESCIYDTFVDEKQAIKLENVYGKMMFIYNNEAPRDIYSLLHAMKQLKEVEKIRVFILDNFMQIDMTSENVYQEQTQIMEKLRTFAVNEKVHIHLVAHPRKTEKFQTRLDLYDVAGSSNLVNKAYNIVSIIRVDNVKKVEKDYEKLKLELLEERYDIENVSTVLEIIKTKGNRCGLVGLSFNVDTKTFTEAPKLTNDQYERAIRIENAKTSKGGNYSWN